MIKVPVLIKTFPLTEKSRLIIAVMEKMIAKDSKREMTVEIVDNRYKVIIFRIFRDLNEINEEDDALYDEDDSDDD